MLIEFKFSNYRSFRDEAVLPMEATGLGTFRKSLIEYRPAGKSTNHPIHLLPAAAIYGKNGGGKSNVIRAFWLAVQFIRNAQRTQHEKAGEAVAANQLYFAVACTMNEQACVGAMRWFRECVRFSRGYADFPKHLLEYSEDSNMLQAISDYAKAADVGIRDMQFDIKNQEFPSPQDLPENVPEGIKAALAQFMQALSDASPDSEQKLRMGEIRAPGNQSSW